MKIFLPLLFFLPAGLHAQYKAMDTLKHAGAYINSFSLLPFSGATTNGDTYMAGFVEQYDEAGHAQALQLVRMTLKDKKITTKKLEGFTGGKGYYWAYTFDELGNVYISMFYPHNQVLKLNLKDSIWYKNLGNPFANGKSVVYSLAAGNDGRVYFGGSVSGTFWSEYDPVQDKIISHPAADPANDYVLNVSADAGFAYLQVGQKKHIELIAVNKKTNTPVVLFTIPNNTRFNISTYRNGIYASVHTDTLSGTFLLTNGKAEKVVDLPAITGRIDGAYDKTTTGSKVEALYDKSNSSITYQLPGGKKENLSIVTALIQTNIRRVFSFPGDRDNIYYIGEYYGNVYRYNLKEQKSYLQGGLEYNVYSILPVNDSIAYLGGYPGGFLMTWNRKQQWTTQTVINNKIVQSTDNNANPRVIHTWKTEGTPPAGFHHTYSLLRNSKGYIVGAGDVIRVSNAAAIGGYDPVADKVYGVNYERFNSFKFSSIALWKDNVVYSMYATTALKPKMYIYNPQSNSITDSIDLGFSDYGKVYISDNTLIGVCGNRIYSYDLQHKKLLWNDAYPDHSIGESAKMDDGCIVVNTRQNIQPHNVVFKKIEGSNFYTTGNMIYSIAGSYIIRYTE